jgi:hypothetical protein
LVRISLLRALRLLVQAKLHPLSVADQPVSGSQRVTGTSNPWRAHQTSVVDSQITSGWGNFPLEIEDTLIHGDVNSVFPASKHMIRFASQTPFNFPAFARTGFTRVCAYAYLCRGR